MNNNQIKAGDLVRQQKHVGIRRPVFRAARVDEGGILYLEGKDTPVYARLWEKLVCVVKNDDGTLYIKTDRSRPAPIEIGEPAPEYAGG